MKCKFDKAFEACSPFPIESLQSIRKLSIIYNENLRKEF